MWHGRLRCDEVTSALQSGKPVRGPLPAGTEAGRTRPMVRPTTTLNMFRNTRDAVTFALQIMRIMSDRLRAEAGARP